MDPRRACLLALLLAACKPKTAPPPVADAAPPIAVADAGPVPLPTGPSFSLYARLPTNNPSLYPLEDGVAVLEVEVGEKLTWKITAVRAGRAPNVIVPKRVSKPGADEMFHSALWGTTDNAFVGLESGEVLRGSAKAPVRIANHYRHIVELRAGQWIGLRSNSREFSSMDDTPVHYDVLAGKGDVPIVPSHILPHGEVAHLADGRICAEVHVFDPKTGEDEGIWTADIEGNQHIAMDHHVHHVFRGADGECWAVIEAGLRGYSVARVNGDEMGTPLDIPLTSKNEWQPRFDADGGIWFVEPPGAPLRFTISDGAVKTTRYPLPAKVDGCDHAVATDVSAVSAEDVWVLAHCAGDGGGTDWLLFHTGPAPEAVLAWPPT